MLLICLQIEDNRLENNIDLDLRSNNFRSTRGQISRKELRLFIRFFVVSLVFLLIWTTWQWLPYISESKWAYFIITSLFFINNSINPTVYLLFNTQVSFSNLRHEISRLLCNSSTKTVPPTHRGYLLTSNKLFKYTTKNQSARISGSSNQHDGRCEASATQSEHNLLTIKISDTINNININKAAVNSAAALVTMTMTNDIDTVDNNDVTNVTVVFKKTHRHLFVDNNIIIIGKNDTCDI
ncbi:unnamed protein product [Onchocerca flexuosa]|uniref:G_PROTEIN_RECEP_F1_2 domain-containing protein n=1 Tax=Onchocerca flexuosa TaxID=387005 RepID=A0A183HYS2_9BILA|nr:unnamed protein product [Onchocerca flexuosa]